MPSATVDGITIINFDMGSATAATAMELLGAISPKAVLFHGKCDDVKHRAGVGELFFPIAAIRDESTSNDYFPPEVPALSAFALQKALSTTIRDHACDYWTGTVHSIKRRVRMHGEEFRKYLQKIRVTCVDMETATIFTVGFFDDIPIDTLLLASAQPMTSEGMETAESDLRVDAEHVEVHIKISIASLKQLINKSLTVKHLKFRKTGSLLF